LVARKGGGVYGQQIRTQIVGVKTKTSTKSVLLRVLLVVLPRLRLLSVQHQLAAEMAKESGRLMARKGVGVNGQQIRRQ